MLPKYFVRNKAHQIIQVRFDWADRKDESRRFEICHLPGTPTAWSEFVTRTEFEKIPKSCYLELDTNFYK